MYLVDDFLGVVSSPPNGEKTVGQYIASWADPEKNWTTYEIVETLLELGTRKEADQVLKFSTEVDSSNEDSKFLADDLILFFESEKKILKLIFIHCDSVTWFFCSYFHTSYLLNYQILDY